MRTVPYLSWLLVVLLHSGLSFAQLTPSTVGELTCGPTTPCRFPNVKVSEGGLSVTTASIAANPNDSTQLVIAAADQNCESTQAAFSSQDMGASWRHVCLTSLSGFTGFGEPIVGFDAKGVAYAGGLQFDAGDPPYAVALSSSTDHGRTWGTPVEVIGSLLGYSVFMPALTVDTSASSPYWNSLYVATTQLDAFDNSQVWVSRSIDGGKTWASGPVDSLQRFPVMDAYSSIGVSADGTIYITWLRCPSNGPSGDCGGSGAQVMVASSRDGAVTWNKPRRVVGTTLAPSDGCYFGCLPNTFQPLSNIPVLAVGNGSTPAVFIAFYDWNGAQIQAKVISSKDGGMNWGSAVRVTNSDFGDEFFTWINVDSADRLVVTWLDRRNDPNNLKFQPYFTFSTDGGTSFRRSRPLSNYQSDPESASYMGDYRTHISVGNAVYAVWMDHATSSWQVLVGGAQF